MWYYISGKAHCITCKSIGYVTMTTLHDDLHRFGSMGLLPKLRVAHSPGLPGTHSPSNRVSDPDMHHGTCETHVPWCMSGSLPSVFLWSRWREKRSRQAFPAHAQPNILRIWQEAHGKICLAFVAWLQCCLNGWFSMEFYCPVRAYKFSN